MSKTQKKALLKKYTETMKVSEKQIDTRVKKQQITN